MTTKKDIADKLKLSMINGLKPAISIFREIKTAITNFEKQEMREATEKDIEKVILSVKKQHIESKEMYEQANRLREANIEISIISIIDGLLPQEMPEDEIKRHVAEFLSTYTEDITKKAIGPTQKYVKEKADGRIVNGKLVSTLVMEASNS